MHFLRRNEKWLVAAFMAVLGVFFYWKILFTNQAMFPGDAATFFYPYLDFVHDQMRHFRLPLWDPYAMSGFPIIGDLESQIFYPINWLFVLLHPFGELPYKLMECQEILHFVLAGTFMYFLALDFIDSRAAALCSGVLFMFSGAMVVHTQHLASIDAIAWYPLIFLLARRGILKEDLFLSASAGIVFGIQLLAGHWQHSVYLGVFLFLYFAYEILFSSARTRHWSGGIIGLLLIGGIGSMLAMVQLIPTHELGDLSVRSYLNYSDITVGNDRRFLLTLFLPNFYGGLNGVPAWSGLTFNYVFLTVPGCLLSLLGLFETLRRRNFFWLGLILLCTEISFGNRGVFGNVIYHTPILNMFRNPNTFFDVANFSLCLMAAFGANVLFSKTLPPVLLKWLPAWLTLLTIAVAVAGLVFQLGDKVHGWQQMLAVLVLVNIAVIASIRNKVSILALQGTLLGLMLFQLFYYQMNQSFNAYPADPRKHLSYGFALGQNKAVDFLHADPKMDFRIAAIGDPIWSDSGPNVWHIPGIYGWNPIALRRYDEYIRGFTNVEHYATPWGGPDTNLNSSMMDLLGVKYVVLQNSKLAHGLGLQQPNKFEKLFTDWGNLDGYRKQEYLSKTWFYPKAYAVPDEADVFALMSSNWFDGRRALLIESGQSLPSVPLESPLTIKLGPEKAQVSSGLTIKDPQCATPIPMLSGWAARQDDWLRYDLPSDTQPGQYVLLMEYTAAQRPTPSLDVAVQSGATVQSFGPIALPSTVEWRCDRSRTVDLGKFDLVPGMNRLKIVAKIASNINIYRLWFIRLPAQVSQRSGSFSFTNYKATENHISFQSEQDQSGFVLLNEINYPGWKATVDGHPVPIIQGDGIFRVVYIPAGSHDLDFRFWPKYFSLGATISIITLASFLLLTVRRFRR